MLESSERIEKNMLRWGYLDDRGMPVINQRVYQEAINQITTEDAAVILGIKQRMVQKHCVRLVFEKIGGHYLLSPRRVEQIRQVMQTNPLGRPKKEQA